MNQNLFGKHLSWNQLLAQIHINCDQIKKKDTEHFDKYDSLFLNVFFVCLLLLLLVCLLVFLHEAKQGLLGVPGLRWTGQKLS